METTTIEQEVAQKFKTPEGQIVDVIYTTSDGGMHFSPDDAISAAAKLVDKTVAPHYKDGEVRKLAEKYPALRQMVFVTDIIKLAKVMKQPIEYKDYVAKAKKAKMLPVVPENIFEFVYGKVFRMTRIVMVGQKDTIYVYGKGIVEAYFIRRYDIGQIWLLGDDLIFTCPTNTMLGGISNYDIFWQFLGEDPRKQAKTA